MTALRHSSPVLATAGAAALLAGLAPAAQQSDQDAAKAGPVFSAPILLTADGEALGKKQLYPSPRLYDIDADGQRELVIGDLFGHVHFAEKVGDDPATWGKLEKLVTDERALKFHNW